MANLQDLPQRSFVIQTSFLGDAVLTLPFLYRLLERGDEVVLIAAPRNKMVFERAKASGLSRRAEKLHIVSWDKKTVKSPWALFRFAQSLREKYFSPEFCYCIHRSFSTSLVGLFSGARRRLGFSSGAASFFYTDLAVRNWDNGQHEIEKNLDLLRITAPCTPWPVDAPTLLGAKKNPKEVVAFSLGSPWATKEWSLENAIPLIQRLVADGTEVWLLGDKAFAPKAEAIEKKVESKLLKNFSGKTGIEEWIECISQAAVVVSGDSAAVHVASDLAVPVVAIFGPTVPQFGFAPWRRNSKILALDMDCRPCDIHGPRKCPLGHHGCMKNLKADWVYETTREIISPRL